MRKQYHLRPSKSGGFDAWDVDKLIDNAKGLPVIELQLSEINELDEPFWYQSSSSGEPRVASCRSIAQHMKLVQETDLAYPIIISHEGRIMDGMHRVVRALIEGRTTIKAVKFDKEIAPDFVGVNENDLKYD